MRAVFERLSEAHDANDDSLRCFERNFLNSKNRGRGTTQRFEWKLNVQRKRVERPQLTKVFAAEIVRWNASKAKIQ